MAIDLVRFIWLLASWDLWAGQSHVRGQQATDGCCHTSGHGRADRGSLWVCTGPSLARVQCCKVSAQRSASRIVWQCVVKRHLFSLRDISSYQVKALFWIEHSYRISQPLHHWHFAWDDALGWRCLVHCRHLAASLGSTLSSSTLPQLWSWKMSLANDLGGPLGWKLLPLK